MQKAASRRLEVFDGGVEGLFRYHRARRRLALCLFIPLAAGAIAMPERQALMLAFLGVVLVCSGLCMRDMLNLAVYAEGGDPASKSRRVRELLWENATIHCKGLFVFALATAAALAWQRSAGAPAAEIRFNAAVVLGHVFFFCCIPVSHQALAYLPVKPRRMFQIAPYAALAAALYLFFFDETLAAGARLALALPPCLLLPLPFALWLASPARRDDWFEMAYYSCWLSWFWAMFAYFFILRMPVFFDADLHGYLSVPQGRTLTETWALGLPWLAYFLAMGQAVMFMRAEKIRRGRFVADIAALQKESAGELFKSGSFGLGRRREIARAGKPLLGSARCWRRVRRMTGWGRFSWAVALLSSLAAWHALSA